MSYRSNKQSCLMHYNVYYKLFYPYVFESSNDKQLFKDRKKAIYVIYNEKKNLKQQHNKILILDCMIKFKIIEDCKYSDNNINYYKNNYISYNELQKTIKDLPIVVINNIYNFIRPKHNFIKEIELISSNINEKLDPKFKSNSFYNFYFDFYINKNKPEFFDYISYGDYHDNILVSIFSVDTIYTQNDHCTSWYKNYIRKKYFFLLEKKKNL